MAILGFNAGTQYSGWGTGTAYHGFIPVATANGTINSINVNAKCDDGNNHDFHLTLFEYDISLNEWNRIDTTKIVNGGGGGVFSTLTAPLSGSLTSGKIYMIHCKGTAAYQYVWDNGALGTEQGTEGSNFDSGNMPIQGNYPDATFDQYTGYTYDCWIDYTPSGGGTPATATPTVIDLNFVVNTPIASGKGKALAGVNSATFVVNAPIGKGKAKVTAPVNTITYTVVSPVAKGKGKATAPVNTIAYTINQPVCKGKGKSIPSALALTYTVVAPIAKGKGKSITSALSLTYYVIQPIATGGAGGYGGILRKHNGTEWVLYRLKYYNGRNVEGMLLRMNIDGVWKLIQQA